MPRVPIDPGAHVRLDRVTQQLGGRHRRPGSHSASSNRSARARSWANGRRDRCPGPMAIPRGQVNHRASRTPSGSWRWSRPDRAPYGPNGRSVRPEAGVQLRLPTVSLDDEY